MTLLVLAMLKTSVLELKIGGITQTSAQNFANAEAALTKFINDNNSHFTLGCSLDATADADSCLCTNPSSTSTQCRVANVGGNQTSYLTVGGTPTVRVGDPTLSIAAQPLSGAQYTDITVTELSSECGNPPRGSGIEVNGLIRVAYFDVKARSFGTVSGEAEAHQGFWSYCK
jgi:Tfp pilus assembly protein PilX